jgi:2-polyprenyl-6-methoxyphenol hydroxylase-like FAD-dependent oxidoreductase/peroxiredoxin
MLDTDTKKTSQTEVAIIGAGLLGLMNALALSKRGFNVTLIDNIVQQKRSYKVGESLLVFSNGFLRTIGDLDAYLQESYPKDGVWFVYGMEGKESFADTTEWAFQAKVPPRWRDAIKNPTFARSMYYDAQIVRPETEDLLRDKVRQAGNVTFLDSAKVKDFKIAQDDASSHTIDWECGVTKQQGTVEARWLIDCSGRTRLLAKTLGHASEDRDMNDGFQTTAVWAQFDHIEDDLFGEPWRYDFKDGDEVGREVNGPTPTTFRDRCTLHIWGVGYWIWVIRLNDKRVSIGVTWDQAQKPPGKNTKEQFWNIINRYPLLTRVLKEEHVLEFRQYNRVQYMTDTFVSERRYGMVGDAGSIIDAYYSQGVSLSLVTSWHIANIMEGDLRHNTLDREYITRVNRGTRADWHMMRNTIVEKYTSAIQDPRFFILSHLLDFTMLGSVTASRWRLVRWLTDTHGYTSRETALHKRIREKLKKDLYFSQSTFPFGISPETAHKLQGRLQAGIGARARWRIENGVKLGEVKVIARAAGMLPNMFGMIGKKAGTVTDLTPPAMNVPTRMLPDGTEDGPFMFKVAPRMILSIFLAMYGYDVAETEVRKTVRRVKGLLQAARPGKQVAPGAPAPAPAPAQPWGEALKKGDLMPDVVVTGEDGKERQLSEYWREQPTAFVFIRHLNCPHCRMELKRLQRDRAQFERLGGRVVVMTMGSTPKIAQFKAALKLDFPHIGDPEERAYEACGLLVLPNTLADNLKAIRQEVPIFLRQKARGEHGKIVHGGNGWRLGGTFIVDRDGRLAYVFRSESTAGTAPFEEVLAAFREVAGFNARAVTVRNEVSVVPANAPQMTVA